jgi:hypothetical protein
MKKGTKILFYPKGEKYGKQVEGVVVKKEEAKIFVKYDDKIYTPTNYKKK